MTGKRAGLSLKRATRVLLGGILGLYLTAVWSGGPLVAVDVGHTLADPGASSARGRDEFAFNLDFARGLVTAMETRGQGVRLINGDGQIASLEARSEAARGAALLISIHHDSIESSYLEAWMWEGEVRTHTTAKRGYGIFVSRRNPELAASQRCAVKLGQALRRAGFTPSPWHGRKHEAISAADGVWYFDNLIVLRKATVPALLFEAGVIKHREEEVELADPQRQATMAGVMADALGACTGFSETPVPE